MGDTNNTQPYNQEDWVTDREHLIKLAAIDFEEKLFESEYCLVAEELLESLSCVQLDNIDVDIDDNDCTTAATYFQPSKPIPDELKKIVSREDWYYGYPGQAPRLYPEHKGGWFTIPWHKVNLPLKRSELVIDRFGGSAWECIEDQERIRDSTGLVMPASYGWSNEHSSNVAFFPNDKKKPHLACIISDTVISPGMMLKSEVHGAYYLITYQMVIKRFCGHRIKPVMLYTFQGDDFARITQAYYDPDMGKIVIRQSRQLNLRGPKPTEDAWLLMRWMLNTPVGDTLKKSEDGGLPVRAKDSTVSSLEPTTAAAA